jgi:hypothetical protein
VEAVLAQVDTDEGYVFHDGLRPERTTPYKSSNLQGGG